MTAPAATPSVLPSAALVVASGLRFDYVSVAGRQMILDGAQCSVHREELLAVTGPSGSGKSTLLKLLGGLEVPAAGVVRLMDTDLSGLDEDDRARLRAQYIGFVFQRLNLLPFLSAQANVELVLKLKGVPARERRQQALAALDYVGLARLASATSTQLSGGEQQRVAIARALAAGPQLLLCDEPTGSLNEEAAEDIFQLLQDLAHKHRRGVLLITHDERLAVRCDRRLRLQAGRLHVDDRVAPSCRGSIATACSAMEVE